MSASTSNHSCELRFAESESFGVGIIENLSSATRQLDRSWVALANF
jgi:hypothetical protein